MPLAQEQQAAPDSVGGFANNESGYCYTAELLAMVTPFGKTPLFWLNNDNFQTKATRFWELK